MSEKARKYFNDTSYEKRNKEDEALKISKRECSCGWINLMYDFKHPLKKKVCKNCEKLVYLDKKDEFKDIMQLKMMEGKRHVQ